MKIGNVVTYKQALTPALETIVIVLHVVLPFVHVYIIVLISSPLLLREKKTLRLPVFIANITFQFLFGLPLDGGITN